MSSSSMMMRSISWWEMSILNESSIALPYVAASAVARSGATIVEPKRGVVGRATRVVSFVKSAPAPTRISNSVAELQIAETQL